MRQADDADFHLLSPEDDDAPTDGDATLPDLSIRPGLKIDLTETEQMLIRRLFAGCRTVLIDREFGGGYSGCRVFRVVSWRRIEHAPLVVKTGPLEIIRDEALRHKTYVADVVPLLAAEIRRTARYAGLGAIGYTYLGGPIIGEETGSLGDYYQCHSATEVLKVLEHLLVRSLGSHWYVRRRAVDEPLYFETYYGPHFPTDLTLALHEISVSALPPDSTHLHFPATTIPWKYHEIAVGTAVQLDGFLVRRLRDQRIDLSHPRGSPRIRATLGPAAAALPDLTAGQPVWLRGSVTGRQREDLAALVKTIFAGETEAAVDPRAPSISIAGMSYTNPLATYQTYLNQRLPHNVATIHGDLHLLNIFVDQFGRPWLIDPGRVAEGHVLFDFIELETYLRHAILGKIPFTFADLADFEHRLIRATIAPAASAPPADPTLAKAFEVILGIRTFAARFLAPEYLAANRPLAQEYFPALLLYTLSTLKYYQGNGEHSARHAFLTAALLATFLEEQRDWGAGLARAAGEAPPQQQREPRKSRVGAPLPVGMSVTDPVLEYQAFYLAKAAGDSQPQEAARQQMFVAQVQRAADALRAWLKLPPETVAWEQAAPADPSQMICRYFSGRWQDAGNTTYAWLFAYQMHDTYLLRCAVERPGPHYTPATFEELRRQIPWQPDTSLPEWLGQHRLYYTCATNLPATELARIIFDTPAPWHTSLTYGDLYCLPQLETTYLLVGATPEQVDPASDFFDRLGPQLGWYIRKAVSQKKQYDIYLAPSANAMEQLVLTYLTEARALSRLIRQGDQTPATLATLREHVHTLEGLLLDYQALLSTARQILNTMTITIASYCRAVEPDELLARPVQNEIFVEQRRGLELLSEQIKADIAYWQITLDSARESLGLLRA